MRWFYRVRRWHPERHGEPCELLAQGRNGNRMIVFEDGFRMVAPFWSVRLRKESK